ncbi:MAG: zinc metallopeptidase [Acidobacteriota bacterium]|nr:zinc metallopeptidase [Acidobacteriota bacterium]MDW3228714.1 zinc metallopeptidase [Acidobacteriota bacterium]MDY0231782.1 zinc metallopeptidase [Candidatus Saccharicenans sp.]
MFFYDFTFWMLIPVLIFSIYAQSKVKSTFTRFSKVISSSRITAAEAAAEILKYSPARDVQIGRVSGNLTDHYDPRKKILRLSESVYDSPSIAALGVAAHEAGHAIQHAQGYAFLALRNLIYPVASFGSNLAFPLFFVGLIFGSGARILMDIGIFLFSAAVLFSVITLPVEFNASRRALGILRERGFLNNQELIGAKKVLSAAAMTYVASTAMAAIQLFRMILLRNSRS